LYLLLSMEGVSTVPRTAIEDKGFNLSSHLTGPDDSSVTMTSLCWQHL